MPTKAQSPASLGERLRRIGVEVRQADDGGATAGWIPVSPVPFRTLGAAFTVSRVRFYAIDGKRIKLSHPRLFFDLPAIDVSQFSRANQIERSLRLSWEKRLAELHDAERWLEQLGADVETQLHGTRLGLHLTGVGGPAALVRRTHEIVLPSSGALSHKICAEPSHRVFRPQVPAELPSELEMSVTQQMQRVAVSPKPLHRSAPIGDGSASRVKLVETPKRILLLDDLANDLASVESALLTRGFDYQSFRDSARALEAFRQASFDLVISGVRMSRCDGLEFTSRVRELAGIERLPVVLLDEFENRSNAKAAIVAGAAAYLWKPFEWEEAGEMLVDLIEHPSQRRFTRYGIRLQMRVAHAEGTSTERTETIARGGIALRTPRDPPVGSLERYLIRMPTPLEPVEVEGVVVTRVTLPGQASVISGVRLGSFGQGSEARWIQLIEALERRQQPSDRRRD